MTTAAAMVSADDVGGRDQMIRPEPPGDVLPQGIADVRLNRAPVASVTGMTTEDLVTLQ